jgi:hypothetical protein
MRMAYKNKTKMYFVAEKHKVPVYETDDDGNILYITVDGKNIPVETGNTKIVYGKPIEMRANIAMSGGDAQATEFGLSVSDYDATIVCAKGRYGLKEGSYIWHTSKVSYLDEDDTEPDVSSADYVCIKVSESINLVKYVLKAVVK